MKKLVLPFLVILAVILVLVYISMDKVHWGTAKSSTLGIQFDFPIHSAYANTPLKDVEQNLIAYDHKSDGVGDWTLSTADKNQILAGMNCDALRNKDVYLPVDGTAPMQCGVVKSPSGIVSLYAIGVGRPYEGTAFPESMVVTFGDTNAAVMYKIVQFPQIEKLVNQQVSMFVQAYPQATIWPPDKDAQTLYDHVDQIVVQAVTAPFNEVKDGIAELQRIAGSVQVM